jgi:hypothetical protein
LPMVVSNCDIHCAGAGIILSNGAIQRILPVLQDCIQNYKDCFAGDVRVSLCMRDAGIYLTGNLMMHARAPYYTSFGTDACGTAITFHHITGPQLQTFDLLKKSGNLRNDFIVQTFVHGELRNNTNLSGWDFDKQPVADYEQCDIMCKQDWKCVAWTYQEGICYLKNGLGRTKTLPNTYSKVYPMRYRCNGTEPRRGPVWQK